MPPSFVPRPPVLPKSRPVGDASRRANPAPVLARQVLPTLARRSSCNSASSSCAERFHSTSSEGKHSLID